MKKAFSLHQLVAPPHQWDQLLNRLQQVWQNGDLLLLLAEAAQGYQDPRLQQFNTVAMLDADAVYLGIAQLPPNMQAFNMDDWAEHILRYQRHITWR